ncbi:conserved hypothetical protein [Neospora caninum Liverpool]|uniref:Transmembrane protein n=1 Tax=Neospora caninum (strain Liverpool) TaxID=572307 RepID=F0VK53_NEOCL|nr:conserved hypothetical protein [Neospora caninum Liverpool]CBZ54454.1 conserved hypothetical protein [Neospora caninum Liverpool]CEL69166.1 TPA: hypothetical protein BN1204_048830 [Neospora caninum Liverpool]|eukprot:XP_003884484.1 conserved hypothetical protein [Neospora caninum Liverpool]
MAGTDAGEAKAGKAREFGALTGAETGTSTAPATSVCERVRRLAEVREEGVLVSPERFRECAAQASREVAACVGQDRRAAPLGSSSEQRRGPARSAGVGRRRLFELLEAVAFDREGFLCSAFRAVLFPILTGCASPSPTALRLVAFLRARQLAVRSEDSEEEKDLEEENDLEELAADGCEERRRLGMQREKSREKGELGKRRDAARTARGDCARARPATEGECGSSAEPPSAREESDGSAGEAKPRVPTHVQGGQRRHDGTTKDSPQRGEGSDAAAESSPGRETLDGSLRAELYRQTLAALHVYSRLVSPPVDPLRAAQRHGEDAGSDRPAACTDGERLAGQEAGLSRRLRQAAGEAEGAAMLLFLLQGNPETSGVFSPRSAVEPHAGARAGVEQLSAESERSAEACGRDGADEDASQQVLAALQAAGVKRSVWDLSPLVEKLKASASFRTPAGGAARGSPWEQEGELVSPEEKMQVAKDVARSMQQWRLGEAPSRDAGATGATGGEGRECVDQAPLASFRGGGVPGASTSATLAGFAEDQRSSADARQAEAPGAASAVGEVRGARGESRDEAAEGRGDATCLRDTLETILLAVVARHSGRLFYTQGMHDVAAALLLLLFNAGRFLLCVAWQRRVSPPRKAARLPSGPRSCPRRLSLASSPSASPEGRSAFPLSDSVRFERSSLCTLRRMRAPTFRAFLAKHHALSGHLADVAFSLTERLCVFHLCDFFAASLDAALLPWLAMLSLILRRLDSAVHAVFRATAPAGRDESRPWPAASADDRSSDEAPDGARSGDAGDAGDARSREKTEGEDREKGEDGAESTDEEDPHAPCSTGAELQPCTSWLITIFAHSFSSFPGLCRVLDCSLAAHPLFPLYFAATVLSRQRTLIFREFEEALASPLAGRLPLAVAQILGAPGRLDGERLARVIVAAERGRRRAERRGRGHVDGSRGARQVGEAANGVDTAERAAGKETLLETLRAHVGDDIYARLHGLIQNIDFDALPLNEVLRDTYRALRVAVPPETVLREAKRLRIRLPPFSPVYNFPYPWMREETDVAWQTSGTVDSSVLARPASPPGFAAAASLPSAGHVTGIARRRAGSARRPQKKRKTCSARKEAREDREITAGRDAGADACVLQTAHSLDYSASVLKHLPLPAHLASLREEAKAEKAKEEEAHEAAHAETKRLRTGEAERLAKSDAGERLSPLFPAERRGGCASTQTELQPVSTSNRKKKKPQKPFSRSSPASSALSLSASPLSACLSSSSSLASAACAASRSSALREGGGRGDSQTEGSRCAPRSTVPPVYLYVPVRPSSRSKSPGKAGRSRRASAPFYPSRWRSVARVEALAKRESRPDHTEATRGLWAGAARLLLAVFRTFLAHQLRWGRRLLAFFRRFLGTLALQSGKVNREGDGERLSLQGGRSEERAVAATKQGGGAREEELGEGCSSLASRSRGKARRRHMPVHMLNGPARDERAVQARRGSAVGEPPQGSGFFFRLRFVWPRGERSRTETRESPNPDESETSAQTNQKGKNAAQSVSVLSFPTSLLSLGLLGALCLLVAILHLQDMSLSRASLSSSLRHFVRLFLPR